MGIADQAKSAVKEAFRVAGDLKTSITLKTATSTYNAVTGVTTKTWAEETAFGLLTEYSKWEIANGVVQVNDRRLIIRQADFGEEPDISDNTRIEIADVLYQIVPPVKFGLVNTVWDLQIRKA